MNSEEVRKAILGKWKLKFNINGLQNTIEFKEDKTCVIEYRNKPKPLTYDLQQEDDFITLKIIDPAMQSEVEYPQIVAITGKYMFLTKNSELGGYVRIPSNEI